MALGEWKKWSFLVFALLIINVKVSYCQKGKDLNFTIQKDKNYAQTIEDFKKKYGVLVAYSPDLAEIVNQNQRTIHSATLTELFGKICQIFQLEYIPTDSTSFLVRTDLKALSADDQLTLHINLTEARDGLPVTYATVYDPSKKYFGFTDEFGDCFIRLPKTMLGTKLIVHSLAHQELIIETQNQSTYHKVKLKDDPIKVIPLTISTLKNKLSFSKLQGISVSQNLINKLRESSVFQADLVRTIQLLPGVGSIDDAKSSVRIRGANEEATLLLLDKMPIYKADHFYGIFSAFNSYYINEVNLLKNNIPVEYGGRTSGMLKMDSDRDVDSIDIKADINLINAGGYAAIPLFNRFSIKMAARKSYTDLLNSSFSSLNEKDSTIVGNSNIIQNLFISRPSFDFWDYNAKLTFNSGQHQLDANIFESDDRFNNQYFASFEGFAKKLNEETFSQTNHWKNKSYGINHIFKSNKVEAETNVYNTKYNVNYLVNSQLIEHGFNGIKYDTADIYNTNGIQDFGIKSGVKLKEWYQLHIGVEYIHHNNHLLIENDRQTIFSLEKLGSELAIFTSIELGKQDKWHIKPGLRYTYLHYLKTGFVLPQIYTHYMVNDHWSVKASAAKHIQNVRLLDHENILGQKQQFFALANGTNIPVGRGQNLMVGTWWSSSPWTIDVEAYYRTLDGAITHATSSPGLRPPKSGKPNEQMPQNFKLFTGQSMVKGIDITGMYDKKTYFTMLTYTWSKAQNRFPEIFSNQYFPTPDDSRHQVKWLNSLTFGKMSLNATYIGATGRPYLDLSSLDRRTDRSQLDINKYIQKLSDYHRLDLGLSYYFKWKTTTFKIGGTVFNVMDRLNVKYRQFIYQLQSPPGHDNQSQNTVVGADVAQLSRTFNINFSVQFR